MDNLAVVVIPAYNEEKNILKVLDDLNKLSDLSEQFDSIVVDDGSTDGTKTIIENYIKNNSLNYKIYTIFKSKNEGKSKALEDGTKFALKQGYNYIIYMDGDYQHKPRDIPKMFKKLKKTNADAVFGIRKYNHIPLHRQISNFLASIFMSLVISIYSKKIYFFRDIQSGFRIIKSDFLNDAYFGEGYSVEHIIALQLAKKKAKIVEEYIEIEYHPDATSHITTKKILDVMKEVAKFVLFHNNK
ncbi:glycosyltransferase family 2 protein [Methanothermococcus okinawensis]|uniref:Glycosyl transferase family 2 n=1 Tax=Methanothermococcus okinawensis (strain DSM 14208 / JCM 11175 / IH1) TaxID=647113 RepID=F8AJX9_METOI|nr:glycosyltransferase family 2 protein [Methanothermococcus okinawensis]AEH07335.1 glycosyl transferase family 2 [Methanothermococcus okinawensis IH1]